MGYAIAVLILAAAVTVIIIYRRKASHPAETRFVCDVCGEQDCLCRRVDKNETLRYSDE